MANLSMKVGCLDDIAVNDADSPYSSTGDIL
jgi:hypothetical protein